MQQHHQEVSLWWKPAWPQQSTQLIKEANQSSLPPREEIYSSSEPSLFSKWRENWWEFKVNRCGSSALVPLCSAGSTKTLLINTLHIRGEEASAAPLLRKLESNKLLLVRKYEAELVMLLHMWVLYEADVCRDQYLYNTTALGFQSLRC